MTGATDVEVAWAAGLFEGEGYFTGGWYNSHGKPSGRFMICAGLGMTDLEPVQKFYSVVEVGRINFVDRSQKGNSKNLHLWQCNVPNDVRKLVTMFLPYLSQRRIERAFELLSQQVEYEMKQSL